MADELPRNPRQEAFERLGGAYEPRVLEPSPPAVAHDDPLARGEVPQGRRVVSPTSTGDLTWAELAAGDPGLAAWCADRWLAAYHRLPDPPPHYAQTRAALHRLAAHVMSPTRQRDRGETDLRWTLGGFGTPFFGADSQLRVEGDQFVIQTATRVSRGVLTTLADAAEYVGFDLVRTDVAAAERHRPLEVDPAAGAYLGEVFGFAFSVLEELRDTVPAELEPSVVRLRPESFAVRLELGRDVEGRRASFAISPGNDEHPEPHVAVEPWDRAGYEALTWNALGAAEDQRATALDFLRARLS